MKFTERYSVLKRVSFSACRVMPGYSVLVSTANPSFQKKFPYIIDHFSSFCKTILMLWVPLSKKNLFWVGFPSSNRRFSLPGQTSIR